MVGFMEGLFDDNPLAIIRFSINDVNEEHGVYAGSYRTWLPSELVEQLEMMFGKVTLVSETDTEIRYTYKKGEKGGLRQGRILVTFANRIAAGQYEDRSEKYKVTPERRKQYFENLWEKQYGSFSVRLRATIKTLRD